MQKFVAFLGIFSIIISLGCASVPPGPASIKKNGMKPVNSAQHYSNMSEGDQKKYFGAVYRSTVNTLPPVAVAPARSSADVNQAQNENSEPVYLASDSHSEQYDAALDKDYSPSADSPKMQRVNSESKSAPKKINKATSTPAKSSFDVYQAQSENPNPVLLASNSYTGQNDAVFDNDYPPYPELKKNRREKAKPSTTPKQVDRAYELDDQINESEFGVVASVPSVVPYLPPTIYRAPVSRGYDPASSSAPQTELPIQTTQQAVIPRKERYVQESDEYHEWCIICKNGLS